VGKLGFEAAIPGARRLAWAVAASFSLLLAAGIAAAVLALQAADAERWVTHTLEVRRVNQALLADVQEATLGERGYLITRDPRYLQQFQSAKAAVPQSVTRLRDLTRDNPAARPLIDRLQQAAEAQVRELDRTVDLLQRRRPADAIEAVRSHLVVNHMQEVRAASHAIEAAESRLLAAREARVTTSRALLLGAIAFALLAAVLLAVFVVNAGRRYVAELALRSAVLAEEMARREASEGQLRQMHKMDAIGQLTGGIAHDFNNMLAIIIGNLDMLARRVADDPSRRRFVDPALEGANRAARLTQSLLAFSRQQPLAPKPVDVNAAVAEISQILRSTLGEQISIETVLAGGLWPAMIDRSQLESATLNLAINARDAMPRGGKLTLETANTYLDDNYARANAGVAPGQYVLLALTDTGVGMPPEVAEKAFDPFFTTKAAGQGTGLGLSQVHGFIKQSGGHVKIYTEPERGTTVKLYLPRSFAPASRDAPPEPPPEVPRASASVLVAEDETGVRELAVSALRDMGYRVYDAANGRAALELLAAHDDIVLLLTDVVMPGMTGRQLCEAALQVRPHLKVLYMTGYTRNAIVHNGVLDPDARLLTKPFTLAALAHKVREALDG
jgi:signal transduction histidine kinase